MIEINNLLRFIQSYMIFADVVYSLLHYLDIALRNIPGLLLNLAFNILQL